MEIDPNNLAPTDCYKLLIGCIVPRPIAFVSTRSPDRQSVNVAPFSFYNGVGSNPMTLLFCPANKPDGSEKDTLRNCKPREEGGTGEFIVNVVSNAIIKRVVAASEPVLYGESEFDLTGLTMEKAHTVKSPRVAESPASFECQTVQIVRTNPGKPGGGNVVIGRVVHVTVRDDLINERYHTDPALLDAVGRMGGIGYCRTRERFEIPFGRAALEAEI